jgi:hypothetical protein
MPKYPGSHHIHAPASESQVQQFERDFGHKLPTAFRDFVLQTNGIRFELPYCFPLREYWLREHQQDPKTYPPLRWPPDHLELIPETVTDRVALIKGLAKVVPVTVEDKYKSLSRADESYGFCDRLPDDLLLVGYTTENDVLCLGCAGHRCGKVYVWGTAWCDFPPEEAMNGLQFVADSFEQFWEQLLPDADE